MDKYRLRGGPIPKENNPYYYLIDKGQKFIYFPILPNNNDNKACWLGEKNKSILNEPIKRARYYVNRITKTLDFEGIE